MTDLLSMQNAVRIFRSTGGGWLSRTRTHRAVDGVSIALAPGETVALVGESGSGKTTLGRLLLGLDHPDEGHVTYDGADLRTLHGPAWQDFRRNVQVVFQDNGASLNPRRNIASSIALPLRHNLGLSGARVTAGVETLLDRVGLDPARFGTLLPHELSGGQRQRVGIARALASNPRVIVADEPVSALDVSVRAQILRLMRDLQREDGLATLFITHDLGVVAAIADRVVVLYRGRVMEQGPTKTVMRTPAHPYTQALLAAMPHPDRPPAQARRPPASRVELPGGCRYAAACPHTAPICTTEPALRPAGPALAACHFAGATDHAL